MTLTLLVLKATVLFVGAMGVACLYRRAPERRHQAWTIAFAAILALPLLAVVLPPLEVPVPSRWSWGPPAERLPAGSGAVSPAARDPLDPTEAAAVSPPSLAGPASPPPIRTGPTWPAMTTITAGLWLAGSGCALVMIALSLWRVRRLSGSATEVRDPDWRLSAAALAGQLGMPRAVRLLLTDQIDTPMAGGFLRPTIFLPASSTGWSDECRDAVLVHELVHLVRRDPLRHLAARLTLAIYWFHPAAWVAARWAALACEDACDDAVVRSGIRPSSYARVLLELAESAGRSRAPLVALPIVQPSLLERRLMMILSHDTTRTSTRTLPMAAVGCVVLTVALAAARPSASVAPADAAAPEFSGALPAALAPAASDTPACQSDWVDGPAAGSDRMEYRERVGARGYTRVILKRFGDLRVCLFAEEAGDAMVPSEIAGQAARVVLEARQPGTLQQLEVTRGAADAAWRLNGVTHPADSVAAEWRRYMLGVLDATWELSRIRGELHSLESRIRSMERDRRADPARIAALRKELQMRHRDHGNAELTKLEVRRQEALTRLRQIVEAKAGQAEPATGVPTGAAEGGTPKPVVARPAVIP